MLSAYDYASMAMDQAIETRDDVHHRIIMRSPAHARALYEELTGDLLAGVDDPGHGPSFRCWWRETENTVTVSWVWDA